jgi:hypothetical protein
MLNVKREVTFRKLNRELLKASAAERIEIAHAMLAGQLAVTSVTAREAGRLVSFVAATTGWPFMKPPKTDAEIDREVKRLDPARVMASLDRLTQPQFDFPAE